MKTYPIFLLAVGMLFTACQKPSDDVFPRLPERVAMETSLRQQLPAGTEISFRFDDKTTDCLLPACNIAMQEQYAVLQQQANDLCQPLFNCVECCLDGWVVFATLYAEPTAIKCKELDLNSALQYENL